MASIAVIGAGLSGLVTARKLSQQHDVTVFEKSAGFGGRMATRTAGDYVFDHGTQFFTANTPRFQQFLQPMIEAGVIAMWPARCARMVRSKIIATQRWNDEPAHYVGTPHMNSPARWLAEQLNVRLQVTVAHVDQRGQGFPPVGFLSRLQTLNVVLQFFLLFWQNRSGCEARSGVGRDRPVFFYIS